jgi:hypothetical protein
MAYVPDGYINGEHVAENTVYWTQLQTSLSLYTTKAKDITYTMSKYSSNGFSYMCLPSIVTCWETVHVTNNTYVQKVTQKFTYVLSPKYSNLLGDFTYKYKK